MCLLSLLHPSNMRHLQLYAPDKFVLHTHRDGYERNMCHWGFDATNWRHYVHLCENVKERDALGKRLTALKGRYQTRAVDSRQVMKRSADADEEVSAILFHV
jgi:hypothetical protein